MSYFLGGLNAQTAGMSGLVRTDESWYLRAGRGSFSHTRRQDSGYGSRCRYTTLWPGSSMTSGDKSADFGFFGHGQDGGTEYFQSWSPWQRSMRGNGRLAHFSGYTYNAAGGILGGAVVQGFRTSDDQFVGQTASDDNGYYTLGTPYPSVQHYLVAYAAGSPDVAGTTVNTLTTT